MLTDLVGYCLRLHLRRRGFSGVWHANIIYRSHRILLLILLERFQRCKSRIGPYRPPMPWVIIWDNEWYISRQIWVIIPQHHDALDVFEDGQVMADPWHVRNQLRRWNHPWDYACSGSNRSDLYFHIADPVGEAIILHGQFQICWGQKWPALDFTILNTCGYHKYAIFKQSVQCFLTNLPVRQSEIHVGTLFQCTFCRWNPNAY